MCVNVFSPLKMPEVCLMLCFCIQALAGPGISNHLHHRPSRYAETARGILALAAQFPPRNDLLFWRPGSWSPAAKNHLPQEPYTGGTNTLALALSCAALKPHTHIPLIVFSLTSVTLRSILPMAPWRTSLFTTCSAWAPRRYILLADLRRSTRISARYFSFHLSYISFFGSFSLLFCF